MVLLNNCIPLLEKSQKINDIEVTLQDGEYVAYGKPIDIKKITIKETYKSGEMKEVTDYSNYSITPKRPETIGNTTITVKNKKFPNITKECSVTFLYFVTGHKYPS